MSVAVSGESITFNDNSVQNTAAKVGMVNRIINGSMTIDQRNAGASVSASANSTNYFAVDRFLFQKVSGGVVTMQQSNTAPVGFSYSLKALVATADSSVAAGDFANITQPIEGFNTADFGFGAAGASTATVSFWVRSNLTGTYGVALVNSVGNRSYVTNYTINAANTWEQKTITVAGDTSGTWLKDNSAGFLVRFGLMVGTNFQQTAGSWGTVNAMGSSSQVNWMATVGNDFYITGVQLEKGSTATSFDYRPYGTELALCQRYGFQINIIDSVVANRFGFGMANSTTKAYCGVVHPVPMRVKPSITISSTIANYAVSDTTAGSYTTAISTQSVTSDIYKTYLDLTVASGLTAFRPVFLEAANTSGTMFLSSEL